MKFKIIVIEVRRMTIEVNADSAEKAKTTWRNGKLISTILLETEIVDVLKVA